MSILCRLCAALLLLVSAWVLGRELYFSGVSGSFYSLLAGDLFVPKFIVGCILGSGMFAALGKYLAPERTSVRLAYGHRRRSRRVA